MGAAVRGGPAGRSGGRGRQRRARRSDGRSPGSVTAACGVVRHGPVGRVRWDVRVTVERYLGGRRSPIWSRPAPHAVASCPSTLLALVLADRHGRRRRRLAMRIPAAPTSGIPARAVAAGAVQAVVGSSWVDPEPEPALRRTRPPRVGRPAPHQSPRPQKPASAPVREADRRRPRPPRASRAGTTSGCRRSGSTGRSPATPARTSPIRATASIAGAAQAATTCTSSVTPTASSRQLHDAYVRGSLKKGMKLHYADGKGKVHTYKLAWWKVTTPTKGTWAYKRPVAPEPDPPDLRRRARASTG